VVCWYDAVAFPTVSRVNSVVSGYVLLHLRSISDFTVKVKRLIRHDNFGNESALLKLESREISQVRRGAKIRKKTKTRVMRG
jgi:hypothetical protein